MNLTTYVVYILLSSYGRYLRLNVRVEGGDVGGGMAQYKREYHLLVQILIKLKDW